MDKLMSNCARIGFVCLSLMMMCVSRSNVMGAPDTLSYPKVGELCPDFMLKDVHFYERTDVSLSDFRGRWLVIDFFSLGCASCFESFPRINKERENVRGLAEIILVGRDDKGIRPFYERFRQRYNLDLPVAYEIDLFRRFGVQTVPHIILIDGKGVVRAVTNKLPEETLRAFINGENPDVVMKKSGPKEAETDIIYNPQKPLLMEGNGGEDSVFLSRSVLAKWNGIQAPQQEFINVEFFGPKIQVVGLPLKYLYSMAYGDTLFPWPDNRGSYYGRQWREAIIEVKDSSKFLFDWSASKNRYNYSLILKGINVNSGDLARAMQADLNRYFGYAVVVEERMMPCWRIESKPGFEKKLRAVKGRQKSTKEGVVSLRDVPVDGVVNFLYSMFQTYPPFFNATGISYNIDIDIDALPYDFPDVVRSLNDSGLNLVEGKRLMKVVVIRDSLM